ncbi:MAG: efflux RND transporter periplasmic adaptor subunit [Pseudomonadota bacterium]
MTLSQRLFAAVLFACAPFASGQGPGGTSAVIVAPVESASLAPTQPIAGTVFSRNDLQLTAAVDGRLSFVAEPGTEVARGDVIASLETEPLELQREEQQAQISRAQARLSFLNAQVDRQKNLSSVSETARQETRSDRDVAASDLKIARARVRQLDDQIERAQLRAPFNGVMATRERRAGENVTRGTPLGRLVDLHTVEVRVRVPLKFYDRVAVGDTLEMYGFETTRQGVVRGRVPAVDTRAQSFELRIDPVIDNQRPLTLGELVSVALPLRPSSESLVIPRDALILRREGAYVFRVNDDATASRIQVRPGDSRGDLVAVAGELSAGDRVVIRGAEALRDGASVEIVESASLGPGANRGASGAPSS